MRTKNLMVKNLDDFEVTFLKYWPPLADHEAGERWNDINRLDCEDHHI